MNEHRRDHAITLMCRVLRVARAGFYAWLHEPISDHAREDARLLELIRASYRGSHGVYGARRIFGDLREAGESCGLHRVERLMRENGIKPVRVLQEAARHCRPPLHHRTQPSAARVYRRCDQQGLGDGYHLYRTWQG